MIEQIFISRLMQFLEEDYYPEDLTSRIVEGYRIRSYVRSKDEGILAGNRFIIPFLKYLEFEVKSSEADGKGVKKEIT